MTKMAPKWQSPSVVRCLGIAFQLLVVFDYCSVQIDAAAEAGAAGSSSKMSLQVTDTEVVMDNGLIKVNLSNPGGSIDAIQYDGIDNVMESALYSNQRGYWDVDWNLPGEKKSESEKLIATNFKVIVQDEKQIEVSFTKTFVPGNKTDIPINFDKRFVMLPGRSGFYTYAIYDHPKGAPDVDIDQTRIAMKLSRSLFHYMAVSDDIQGDMPTYAEREAGQVLNYKEAVLLTKTADPKFKGKVDDKYQFAKESRDMNLHGWVSSKPHVGFWIITGSNEFRLGGPIKADLTTHCGPFALSMFLSIHYAGEGFGVMLRDGEAWKMVFGPVFLYLNTDSSTDHKALWEDAKKQMEVETKSWPYNFLKSKDYPTASERGTVDGRLLVNEKTANTEATPAKAAFIGLAQPGEPGSWHSDFKNYQFWTQTDEKGNFKINAVWPGTYNLYAWVPGVLGDFKHKETVIIKPGGSVTVGDVVFEPPRNGTTLWEIGIPDRKAGEFFIPEPLPNLKNYILNEHTEKFREYGLWDRYTDLYPEKDLVYTVGKSNFTKDWFFAHVNRKKEGNYVPTTWTITFPLENVDVKGSYTLRIALASYTSATLQIWINDQKKRLPHFTIKEKLHDNAIARHGIHGRYSEHSLVIPGVLLVKGENSIFINQAKAGYPFFGVMYDYLRLEGPKV